jgi:FkbM family methyltransferase
VASLIRNTITLLKHPRMLAAYCRFTSARLAGQGGRAHIALGATVKAPSFSVYLSALNLAPSTTELAMLRQYATRPNATIIDVGANIGAWAVVLARLNPSARIHAFEPIPWTCKELQENVQMNGASGVNVHQSALSDRSGTVRFDVPNTGTIFGHIASEQEVRDNRASTIEVETVTLDEFCQTQGIETIEFAKIDVEGAEPLVLTGAASMIRERRIEAVYIEIAQHNLQRLGFGEDDVYRVFAEAGYRRVEHLSDGAVDPEDPDELTDVLFAIHP